MIEYDVIGLGENSIDYVYRLPGYPQPGAATSKMRIVSHAVSPGGQVATTLCTCAAFGLTTSYLGAFGSDENGRLIREELETRGVDVSKALTRDTSGRFAVILVDERSGERMVLWHRDSSLDLRPQEVSMDAIRHARLLHVDGVDEPVAIAAAKTARAAGIPVTSDIDRVTHHTHELVAAVTIPIFAEHVPQAITGEPDLVRALRAIRQRHDGLLCATLGARGAILLDGDHLHEAAAFPVEVVDSTAAGDVFRGAFIYALLGREPIPTMLRFANAAAAISCTREGAISSVPTLADVRRLL